MHFDDNEVLFQDELPLGKIEGFKFIPQEGFEASEEINTFISDYFTRKIDRMINEGDVALRLTPDFKVTFAQSMIAELKPTDDILKPDFNPLIDERIEGIPLARMALHLESWLKRQLNAVCDPLEIVRKTDELTEDGQLFVTELITHLGCVARYKIDAIVKKVSPNDRSKLRKAGVRFGQYNIFIRDVLKPAAHQIKLILWALKNKKALPSFPPSGMVTIPNDTDMPAEYYDIAGFKICGDFAVRVDMIEKLADAIRPLTAKSESNPKGEFEITAQHMSLIGKSGEVFDNVLKSLGYDFRVETVKVVSAQIMPKDDSDTNEGKTQPVEAVSDVQLAEVVSDTQPVEAVSDTQPVEAVSDVQLAEVVSDTQPAEAVSDVQFAEASQVDIKEFEKEKKIWFWAPKKSKPTSHTNKKPNRLFNHKGSANSVDKSTSSSDVPSDKKLFSKDAKKQGKKSNNIDKKPRFDEHNKTHKKNNKDRSDKQAAQKNFEPSPYVNMPNTHRIAKENNPFAALMQLKDKKEG